MGTPSRKIVGLTLSAAQRASVDRWWQQLTPEEAASLEPVVRCARARVVARLVDEDARHEAIEESEGDALYEYLVNHELTLSDRRVFHVCTAHPKAAAAIRSGRIRQSFSCGLGAAACPMRQLLDAARGADLELVLVREPHHG